MQIYFVILQLYTLYAFADWTPLSILQVPAWHRSANITKRIELDNGQVQIVKVPFHERLQLWGRGGLLKALQAIGPVIQADDPQTIQAVANALREKVRHCRPLVRAAVDNYVEWLGAPTQPEGGADEEGGSDEAGVPDEGGAVEGGAEEGGAFEAFPNEGFEYEGGAFEGVADEKGQNEAFAHEGAANEGGSDEGGADGGQVRGGGAPPPEGATPRKRQREEFKGANTERRSKKRGGKPPTLSPRGAGPVVSPPPTTATDGPDSLPSASDTLEVLYGPLGIMNLGPLANGPQSLPTPPSHDGGFREYQDNLPEQPAGEADGGEVLRTARRLLTSLSLQCKGERVGPLRVALAAETLLPSVESLFGIQRDFGVLDVDVSVLERLIGLLTGVRGVLEGPEKVGLGLGLGVSLDLVWVEI